jgi:cytochrome c peroxidase
MANLSQLSSPSLLVGALVVVACFPRSEAGAPSDPAPVLDSGPGRPALLPARSVAPPGNPTTPAKVALGKRLFFDRRLSPTREVSCQDCHHVTGPQPSGAGDAPVAYGVAGQRGGRNVPTVWNSAYRSALFWDGRADGLETQARGPLMHPVEMANAAPEAVLAAVLAIPAYRAELDAVFGPERAPGAEASFDEIAKALAAYERTLVTPDSPFDRFVAGEATALDDQQRRGWKKFQARGCIACHGAPTFTGQDYFVRFPLHRIPDEDARYGFSRDLGRYDVTLASADRNRWRVPSLRNVARTAPYLHNGSVSMLEDMVRIMGRAQLNRVLPEEDVVDIAAFLRSLTGAAPEQVPPTLPE